ncbi:hypothetical protein D3C71_2242560 [compost metagenome]
MLAAGVVTFLRMGRGRWYRSTAPGVAKALVILVCLGAVGILGGMAITGIGLAAGRWF